ncbi:hypothetical protein QJQ45_027738 [Haematococcus lacustris]|nr:hypothetical protein QJQ45_027738 [Haematococcus lacustris]
MAAGPPVELPLQLRIMTISHMTRDSLLALPLVQAWVQAYSGRMGSQAEIVVVNALAAHMEVGPVTAVPAATAMQSCALIVVLDIAQFKCWASTVALGLTYSPCLEVASGHELCLEGDPASAMWFLADGEMAAISERYCVAISEALEDDTARPDQVASAVAEASAVCAPGASPRVTRRERDQQRRLSHGAVPLSEQGASLDSMLRRRSEQREVTAQPPSLADPKLFSDVWRTKDAMAHLPQLETSTQPLHSIPTFPAPPHRASATGPGLLHSPPTAPTSSITQPDHLGPSASTPYTPPADTRGAGPRAAAGQEGPALQRAYEASLAATALQVLRAVEAGEGQEQVQGQGGSPSCLPLPSCPYSLPHAASSQQQSQPHGQPGKQRGASGVPLRRAGSGWVGGGGQQGQLGSPQAHGPGGGQPGAMAADRPQARHQGGGVAAGAGGAGSRQGGGLGAGLGAGRGLGECGAGRPGALGPGAVELLVDSLEPRVTLLQPPLLLGAQALMTRGRCPPALRRYGCTLRAMSTCQVWVLKPRSVNHLVRVHPHLPLLLAQHLLPGLMAWLEGAPPPLDSPSSSSSSSWVQGQPRARLLQDQPQQRNSGRHTFVAEEQLQPELLTYTAAAALSLESQGGRGSGQEQQARGGHGVGLKQGKQEQQQGQHQGQQQGHQGQQQGQQQGRQQGQQQQAELDSAAPCCAQLQDPCQPQQPCKPGLAVCSGTAAAAASWAERRSSHGNSLEGGGQGGGLLPLLLQPEFAQPCALPCKSRAQLQQRLMQAHLSTRGRTLKAVAAVLQACCAEDDGEAELCD